MFRSLFAVSLAFPLLTSLSMAGGVEVHSTLAGPLHYIVKSGKTVHKGDVLFVVDPTPLLDPLQKAEAKSAECQAEVAKLQAALNQVEPESQEKIATAEMELRQAQRTLEKYTQVEEPAAEQTLKQAVADAQLAAAQEKSRYDSRDKLLKEGYIRQAEYDEEAVKMDRAKVALDTANAKLKAHTEYEKPDTVEQAQWTIKQKTAALQRAKDAATADLEKAKQELAIAKDHLETAKQAEAEQHALVDQTAITAPADGTVTVAETVSLGEAVQPSEVLATISAK
jgi:multidrug resistance efflux pump